MKASRTIDNARMNSFSDGVYTVAITLLVLNIQVPPLGDRNSPDVSIMISGLAAQWPSYLAYIISFLLVGSTWINHHQMSRYIARTNHRLLTLNLLLLMDVVVIPFATNLLAAAVYTGPEQGRIAAFIYGAIWSVGGVFFNISWRYAIRQKLTDPQLSDLELRSISRRYVLGPVLYAIGCFASLLNVWVGIFIYLAPTIWFLLPDPQSR